MYVKLIYVIFTLEGSEVMKTLRVRKDWSTEIKTIAFAQDTSLETLNKLICSELDIPTDSNLAFYDEQGRRVALSINLDNNMQLRATQLESNSTTQKQAALSQPIDPPGPRPWPIVGNLPHMFQKGSDFFSATTHLVDQYGDIMSLTTPGGKYIYISDPDIWHEVVSQPDVFEKMVLPNELTPLSILRSKTIAGEGLFTTSTTEDIWAIAHRLLMPAFGLRNLKSYVPAIYDQVNKFIQELNKVTDPVNGIDLVTWTTNLTFDVIGRCAINKTFNAITHKEPSQFIKDIYAVLKFVMLPTQYIPIINKFVKAKALKKCNQRMYNYMIDIVNQRRAAIKNGESVPNDLLQTMLTARDKISGKKLADDNIISQIATFLIAGHETTSGLVSYAIYHACKHPDLAQKLADEADRVLGRDYSRPVTWQDVQLLEYCEWFLKETLRITPNIAGIYKEALTDSTLGNGKYKVRKGDLCTVWNLSMHVNPKSFGEDAHEFKPERWSKENSHFIHPNGYNPFGSGIRACIGSQFALIEAKITLACLFQRLKPRLADPNYQLINDVTITLKPKNLHVCFDQREEQPGVGPTIEKSDIPHSETAAEQISTDEAHILFLFGSNMGTSEDFAKSLANQARQRGLAAQVLALDQALSIPTNGMPVIIITSTYNGKAPDNAVQFNKMLGNAAEDSLQGTQFAVCGTGNKQWVNTYQQFPETICQQMQALGATEIIERGICDADGDLEADFNTWSKKLFSKLDQLLASKIERPVKEEVIEKVKPEYEVDYLDFQQPTCAKQSHGHDAIAPQSMILHRDSREWRILKNQNLQSPQSGRVTLHLEIALPSNIKYKAGDHFGVMPSNSPEKIEALANRCGLNLDSVIMIYYVGNDKPDFPIKVPISIRELLSEHVDIQGPLYRYLIRSFSALTDNEHDKSELLQLADKKWQANVVDNNMSVIDLLVQFPSISVDLELLLTILPALKPRYYSISSSPLKYKASCTLTVGVVNQRTANNSVFGGVASNYLLSTGPNSYIRAFIKDTGSNFRIPEDTSTNMLMIATGTGLAPMVGFIQERAAQQALNNTMGKTILYFGCRRHDWDYLYQEELNEYLNKGVLNQVELAFSAEPNQSKQYVQDKLLENAE